MPIPAGVTLDDQKPPPNGVTLDDVPRGTSPPPQPGFFRSLSDNLGATPAIHSLLHPVDAGRQDAEKFKQHPIKSLAESLPGSSVLEGAYQGVKRSAGELGQAYDAAKEHNPAGVISHGISAIPILGSGLTTAAQQAPPTTGHYIHDVAAAASDPGTMGTLTGTAAQLAPIARAGLVKAGAGPALQSAASTTSAPLRLVGGAIRDAAIGDPDAAALRGLRVPANGKKVLPMQDSLQTARPFLQGANSLEDLQAKIGPAKKEIFSPYRQTLDQVGSNPIQHPNGSMTTLADLENERQQLSALNRGLKTGDPAALQLAQQKGLSQADALAQEKDIQSTLDPALSKFGIDPQGIRQAYGAVSRIGGQVSGRSTLLEKPQPSGLGKIGQISLKQPFQAPGQILSGMRDIAAGRPLFRMSPTDVGIREGFADSGPKPSFGQYTPFKPAGAIGAPPIQLGGAQPVPSPSSFRPPPFNYSSTAQRLGRLLPAPPTELGGAVEGTRPPPFHYDTTPMRKGRLLPESTADSKLPMSSHTDIFPEQLPGGARKVPRLIEGKK